MESVGMKIPDVYFPEDCGIILTKLTIRLTQVSHLGQPSSSLLKWDGSKFERLSSQDIDKYLTPHPLKEKASGRPVIMFGPSSAFCAESGNSTLFKLPQIQHYLNGTSIRELYDHEIYRLGTLRFVSVL
eukprot:Em0007g766a